MAYIGIDANGNRMKVAIGTFDASTTENTSINIGFKPKYLVVEEGSSSIVGACIYNEEISTTAFRFGGSSNNLASVNLGGTTANRLYSIDNNGFTMVKASSSNAHCTYYAIG